MFDDSDSKNVSALRGFFILISFLFGGAIVGMFLGVGLLQIINPTTLQDIESILKQSTNVSALRVLQFTSTLCMFFLPALATAYMLSKKPYKWLGFTQGFGRHQLFLVIVMMTIGLPLAGALGNLNKMIPLPAIVEQFFTHLELKYDSQIETIAKMGSFKEYLLSVLMIGLLPALFEETFFRAGIQRTLTDATKRPVLAIALTSIIFSAIHLSYYGFIPRIALSVVLGLIYYHSKSIWLSIIAHFFNNAVTVTLMYYYSLHHKPIKEVTDGAWPAWASIPAVIVLGLAFVLFKFVSGKQDSHERFQWKDLWFNLRHRIK
jgi:uncharacterized protein